MKIEYLGTGPNPINVPALKTEKPISKGDQLEAPDEIASTLIEQGLFAAVEQKKPRSGKPTPDPDPHD